MNKIKRNKRTNAVIVNTMTKEKMALNVVFLVLLVVTIIGFIRIYDPELNIGKSIATTIKNFRLMFAEARPVRFTWVDGVQLVGFTLALAFLTTIIGSIAALVLGLLAARNLTNERVSNALKGFVAFIRAVPTVVWVLIFGIGAGLGAVSAVIGMSFHTVGYLMKAYSESFEEIDESVIEALRASGASWFQIVFQAVLPASITYIISWTFFRFEVNFAVAVAMGAAAGAGGIGYELWMAGGYFYDIREVGVITYLLIAVALIMEVVAVRLKERYHIYD